MLLADAQLIRITGFDLQVEPRLALYRGVGDPRLLREHGVFIAEGRLVVERVLRQWPEQIESVLLTQSAAGALASRLRAHSGRFPVFVAAQDELQQLTGHRFHRGCLAVVRRPATLQARDLTRHAQRVLVAVGVGNPDNMGALFRNALAFGVGAVLLVGGCVDPLYRKALRTSVGAALRVPFAQAEPGREEAPRLLRSLREVGFRTVALATQGARRLSDCAARLASDRLALVVGSEGPGLDEATLAECTERVRIEMFEGIDSLNLAVASGIALHAFALGDARQQHSVVLPQGSEA